jgi:hypothetical protein
MHTLKPAGKDLWNVWFAGGSQTSAHIIERDLSKGEAMKLVNYLNGGAGDSFCVDVKLAHHEGL